MSLTTLTTGAAGFIGSHTVLELLEAGHNVICVDNGCNAYHDKNESLPESLKRVEDITGKKVTFYSVDIRDKKALDSVFKKVSLLYFLGNKKSQKNQSKCHLNNWCCMWLFWWCWNVSSGHTEAVFVYKYNI